MKYTIRFFLVCTSIILCIIGLYFLFKARSKNIDHFNFNPIIHFLSPNQAIEFISSDPDGYVRRFNKLDWKSRNITCSSDYTNFFIDSVIKPTNSQIQQIKSSISKGLELIDQIDLDDQVWVDTKLFKSLPWKFIITNTKQIDEGLPHTRYDTIVLNQNQINSSLNFVDTLIHEQLHVYQKLYPKKFDLYLQKNNFVKSIKYTDSEILYRSNPDTDDWIYSKSNKIYCSEYIVSNPKSIFDVKFSPFNTYKYEHPREKAVYDLVEKLFKK